MRISLNWLILLLENTGNFCPLTRFITMAPFLVLDTNSFKSGLPEMAKMFVKSIVYDIILKTSK